MLIIKEPITLKINRSIAGIRPDMNEKMLANYHLMNVSIGKEELLHITSKPPEIYFAEGEHFQIQTNIKNENKQEISLDIINNLMNRILVAQTENFTYQDTVYISNVLRKLGIRDEKNFMKQVFLLQNEQKETRQLLQKYETNQELLKQLFLEENKLQTREEKQEAGTLEKESRMYLHDEIYKRLETGKIYQDVRNFLTNSLLASQEIYPMEMQIAEQARVASSLILQDMKSQLTKTVFPLQYVHNNRYEYLQELTETNTQELEEQISAAILLNLSDQTYTLRQKQIEENSHAWYSIMGAIFQTAENTWKRYEANLESRKHFSNYMTQRMEEVNHSMHKEGDVIKNIINEFSEGEIYQNRSNYHLQESFIQKSEQTKLQQQGISAEGTYHLTREELELTFLKPEEEGGAEETPITAEQLQKQLEIYSQKNYENYKKITELEKQNHIRMPKDRRVDKKRAQKDALRAMENPGEVLREYMISERKDSLTEIRKNSEKQIYEMFSEETKEIYRNFLMQSDYTEHTFLQHIMAQPEESINEAQREKVQELEQKEQQDRIRVSYPEIAESVERVQAVISKNITNQIVRESLHREIEFVHKKEQVLDHEELLEEIRMQTQRNLKTQQTEEQTIRNERDVRKVIQESVNNIQTQRTEDIEELVQQSMRRQLNQLSEQVYGKLEKKLQTERKRRGYY